MELSRSGVKWSGVGVELVVGWSKNGSSFEEEFLSDRTGMNAKIHQGEELDFY